MLRDVTFNCREVIGKCSANIFLLLAISNLLGGCYDQSKDLAHKKGMIRLQAVIGTMVKYRGDISIGDWREVYETSSDLIEANEHKGFHFWPDSPDDRLLLIDGKPAIFIKWSKINDKSGETGVIHLWSVNEYRADARKKGKDIAKALGKKYESVD